jgi:ERCC4-related helicase
MTSKEEAVLQVPLSFVFKLKRTCLSLKGRIVCLVVDEAHRAQGNYAYCKVVREIASVTRHFRILALTASPGSDAAAVQNMISNLLIAHIEVRYQCISYSDDVAYSS